jgi:hypothetical protein
MKLHSLKTVSAVLVSFVLAYYSIAWVVLRCSHAEDDSGCAIALLNVGAVPMNLECVEPDYHTEAMAESSMPSRLHLTSESVRQTNGNLASVNPTLGRPTTPWLKAGPPPIASSGVPRHLALSVFRI